MLASIIKAEAPQCVPVLAHVYSWSHCRRRYFRQRAQQWVLDDLVDADGAVYAHTMGADVRGPWLSTPSWRTDARIKVSSCFDVKGYRGEAVRVSGARGEFLSNAAERDLVDSCSTQDNGTYLRQPPYEDIDGPSSRTLRLRPLAFALLVSRTRITACC